MGQVDRRTRWTAEQAQRQLDAWQASGLSLKAFAQRAGLRYERLRRWQARSRGTRGPKLVAVELSERPQPIHEQERITIELRCGTRLTVGERLVPATLAELVLALERRAC